MAALTPEQVGQIFCIARLGNDMAPVEAMLTPALASAIAAAEARSAEIQKRYPDEKPPLGDGVPWQAWPDYAPECTVGAVATEGSQSRVAIGYTFPDAPDAGFTDTLVLQQVEGTVSEHPVWRIDDISYGTEGTLRAALNGIASAS
jgi:hypothetical protein